MLHGGIAVVIIVIVLVAVALSMRGDETSKIVELPVPTSSHVEWISSPTVGPGLFAPTDAHNIEPIEDRVRTNCFLP